jgi:CheY-like chemotaxis protein
MLEEDGFWVEAFTDEKSALERLARGSLPDVLVADLHVPPGESGAVIRAFRARKPSAPVIVVTARPHLLDRKSEPPSLLLTKPVEYEALRAMITRATSSDDMMER